jgi:hypothetical protein
MVTRNHKVNPLTREVLLVDSSVDLKLVATVKRAAELLSGNYPKFYFFVTQMFLLILTIFLAFYDQESKARVLALFVSNMFGGDFPSTASSSQEISRLKLMRQSNIIPIGEITRGVCRHRSILYKYLCDRVSIPCELRRGNYAGKNKFTLKKCFPLQIQIFFPPTQQILIKQFFQPPPTILIAPPPLEIFIF